MSDAGSGGDIDRGTWLHATEHRAQLIEPDPVETFAEGLDAALRQLRFEVAGLRAERDALRFDLEQMRASLEVAQHELRSRTTVSDTMRQLQAVVAELTAHRPAGVPTPSTPGAPPPSPGEPLAHGAVEPAAGSALAELRARGLWPPSRAEVVAPDTAVKPAWPPPERVGPPPVGSGGSWLAQSPDAPERPAISWDPDLTRDEPAAVPAPAPTPVADAPAASRGRWRRWLAGAATAICAAVVLAVLLVSVGPRLLPYQTFFVRSGSMAPAIDTGSLVVLTEARTDELEVGDIITFERPGAPDTLVTHRIVGIEGDGAERAFRTKGDANATEDGWRLLASRARWRYSFDVPYLGYVFGALGSTPARLVLLVVPAAAIAVLTQRQRRRPGS